MCEVHYFQFPILSDSVQVWKLWKMQKSDIICLKEWLELLEITGEKEGRSGVEKKWEKDWESKGMKKYILCIFVLELLVHTYHCAFTLNMIDIIFLVQGKFCCREFCICLFSLLSLFLIMVASYSFKHLLVWEKKLYP